jgi:hypothetical protein
MACYQQLPTRGPQLRVDFSSSRNAANDMSRRKTLADFPRFTVTSLRKQPPNADGYTDFEIEGTFDRVIEKSPATWCWLLVGERDCLCVQWKSQDETALSAVFVGYEKDIPDVVGATLYYLSPYWQAFNIWMVLDSQWGWERVKCEPIDAVADDFETQDVSIVDGREVKRWTTLKRADNRGHSTRHYPVNVDGSGVEAGSRVVPGGWDHEHCALCDAHINAGDFGYCDPDDRWMCEACYEKYVIPRDLAFVDEL